MQRHKQKLIKHKFLLVLISLILFFLSNAFFEHEYVEYANMGLLMLVVAASLLTLEGSRRFIIVIGLTLGLTTIVISGFSDILSVSKTAQVTRLTSMMVFFIVVTGICLFSTLNKHPVTVNVLYGAAVTYLLIGMIFATIFYLIDITHTHAFNFNKLTRTDSPWQTFTYYSFVTLTTLGYGDITPVSNIARTFAWLEAAIGQIYLTILIAQLVGSFIAQRGKIE